MPVPRILSGSFWEDGPVTLYAIWQRDDDRTNVPPANVEGYTLIVYDLNDTTAPGAEVWQVGTPPTYADPTGVFLTLQPGVGASPAGYTFKRQIQFEEADDTARLWTSVGGHKYRICVIAQSDLADVDGSRVIWELDCKSVLPS